MQKEDKMSEQNAMTFIQRLEGNETLQNQVKTLTPGDSSGLLTLASEMGFEFTAQELKSVMDQAGELNEEQLDQVAGGIIIVGGKPVVDTHAMLNSFVSSSIQGNLNGGTLNFRKAG